MLRIKYSKLWQVIYYLSYVLETTLPFPVILERSKIKALSKYNEKWIYDRWTTTSQLFYWDIICQEVILDLKIVLL